MQHRYAQRLERLHRRAAADTPPEVTLTPFQQLQEIVIRHERELLNELRGKQDISEEVLRKIENELDLEEGRLALDKG